MSEWRRSCCARTMSPVTSCSASAAARRRSCKAHSLESPARLSAPEPAVNRARLHGGNRAALGVQKVFVGPTVAHVERQGVVDVLEAHRELVQAPALAVDDQRPLL